jgi:hypothetical protein
MSAKQRCWILRFWIVSIVVVSLCVPSRAAAQEEQRSPFLATLAKQIVFDPTTYAPTLIAYDATMRDWKTSQAFFQNGYLERNPRFTLSGLPNDRPLSYQAGRRVILKDAFIHLQLSTVHNATSRSLERMLMGRFPEKRTLISVLGWIERTVFASYLAYELSHQHYRQASENERLAREYGFR